jgi:hypothetical protein
LWLKKHSFLYIHISVDHGLLDTMVPEVLLPVHVKHVKPLQHTDTLTSRHGERSL